MKVTKQDYILKLSHCKLIIGNGFDLHCGLKSSYSDFFDENKKEYLSMLEFLKSVWFVGNFSSLLDQSNSYYDDFKSKVEVYDMFNIWDCFFALSFENRLDKSLWCNIEYEMKKSFVQRDQSYPNRSFWEEVFELVTEGYGSIKFTQKSFLCAAFINARTKKSTFKTIDLFYKYLLKELNDFEVRFGKFIAKQIDDKYKSKANAFIRKIGAQVYSIDSFNYTSFLYNGCIDFKNINGNLEKIEKGISNMIFGIDSTKISPEAPEYIFTKSFRRLSLQSSDNFIIENYHFKNIIIFGHSLNEQDYNYYFPIFEQMKLSDLTENSTIVILYKVYDEIKREEIVEELWKSVSKMLYAYDSFKNINNGNRLMEMLSSNNRLILREI
ncbi:MAG: hypothetical protein J1F31_00430 [Erysipelotrichales bacterium]|nr:hypothetical protein [Erysipelotrichales bacterium]